MLRGRTSLLDACPVCGNWEKTELYNSELSPYHLDGAPVSLRPPERGYREVYLHYYGSDSVREWTKVE